MPADDHLRGMFDEYGAAPEPTDSQREGARRDLYAAMRLEPVLPWWRRRTVGWGAAAVVAAAVFAFVLVIPTSTRAVDANLAEVAAAARTVDQVNLPAGSYIYFRVESTTYQENETEDGRKISYQLPTTEDLWVLGMSELRQRTAHRPEFSSSSDEEVFYTSELAAAEGIGETLTQPLNDIPNEESLEGLSTNPDRLWNRIVDRLSVDPDFAEDDEARIFEHVAQLLGPRLNAPPALRGALLEVLGQLDVITSKTPDGGVVVSQSYSNDFGAYEQMLEIDKAGHLIRDTLILTAAYGSGDIPVGVIQDIRYSGPAVVAEPGSFPAP